MTERKNRLGRRAVIAGAASLASSIAAGRVLAASPTFDLVIANGRVMDPASGRDEIAHIGIVNDRIAAIETGPLQGRRSIDAKGYVVAPGFIDPLVYPTADFIGQKFKISDGVTTTLQMHAGPVDIDAWYADFAKSGSMTNIGTVVGHGALRDAAGVTDIRKAATPEQLEKMKAMAAHAIERGAIGIGYGLEYTPGASQLETVELFRVAARYKVPNHLHIRFNEVYPLGKNVEALDEVIAAAAISGASAEIVHLNSAGGTHAMAQAIGIIGGARQNGIDITASIYPYTGWSTYIGSTIFDPGFLDRFGITYHDIELVSTGERLTKERFEALRAKAPPQSDNRLSDPALAVIGHAMPEEDAVIALQAPFVSIGSDGLIGPDGRGHPRGAGTFSRILGVYVREKKVLPLMEGLRRMTVLPAERMEKAAPSMRDRGRLKLGAFADITIFDPDTIVDRATYQAPATMSAGIGHVIVNGQLVFSKGVFVPNTRPGMPVRRELA